MSHCKNWMGQCGPNVATDGRIRRKFKVRQEPNFEPKNRPVSHDGELKAQDVQPAKNLTLRSSPLTPSYRNWSRTLNRTRRRNPNRRPNNQKYHR